MAKQTIKWSKDLIIQNILELRKQGQPINNTAIIKINEKLVGAAIRYFGSWKNAIEACGINYDAVLKEARSAPQSPHGTWSEALIIHKLKSRLNQGLPINAHALQIDDAKLLAAATSYFGSYGNAIKAINEDYDIHRKTIKWSKEKIIETILIAHKNGAALNDVTVDSLNNTLYGAACMYFGSWKAAIESAGINYSEISKTEKWSDSKIRHHVLMVYNSGLPLNNKTLPPQAYKKFESMEQLMKFCGIVPDKHKTRIIKNNIKSERIKHNISQKSLGKMVGVSHTMIRQIENGLIDPKVSYIIKIASALGVNMDMLYTDKFSLD